MRSAEHQTTYTNFYLQPVAKKQEVKHDSISSYAGYLADSLNPVKPADKFKFELKEIVFQEDSTSAIPIGPVYDKSSIFKTTAHLSQQITPTVRHQPSDDWLTATFLVCLIILAWVRYYYSRRIKQLFKATIAKHNVNQLIREGNVTNERITPALAFVYIASITTIIYQFGSGYLSEIIGITNIFRIYYIIFGAVVSFWMAKVLLVKAMGSLFRTRHEAAEYILTSLIFNLATGIIAFPLTVAGYYSGSTIITYLAVAVFITGLVFRFLRSISISFTSQTFSLVYLFLYLCTLEILPVLILFKIITTSD